MIQEVPGVPPVNEETEAKHSGQSRIPEQVEVLGETASKIYNQFRESEQYGKIQDRVVRTGDYIRDNPIPSVLYSLGAGFILGLLFRRKG